MTRSMRIELTKNDLLLEVVNYVRCPIWYKYLHLLGFFLWGGIEVFYFGLSVISWCVLGEWG